jgi:hypothetical protein
MLADMALDDLYDEPVEGTSTGGRLLQRHCASAIARSIVSTWPRMRRRRFNSFVFSLLKCGIAS